MTAAAIPPRMRSGRVASAWLAVLVAAVLATLSLTAPATAQTGQMLLESDHLVYDYDANIISAIGNVVVRYRGYVLTADRLTYYQTTGRLVAVGNVLVVDGGGNIYEAAQLDVTDDFREGFIEQLYVTTIDRTFFTAETAERHDGRTDFFNSTYTACGLRPNGAERPPFWNVRAAKIIHNEEEQMIYFERARLEFLGVPVVFLPYLATPEPSVTRATGFLFPDFSRSNTLGFGISVPFFWAPAPNYDLTLTPTYLTKAGFLGEAEWRHRTRRGLYSVLAAGIYQTNPGPAAFRGGVRSIGAFDLSRFWSFGWDGALQSDRSFGSTYGVLNPSGGYITSQVHLTGMMDRLYVDARLYHFRDVRPVVSSGRTDQARQAFVRPVIDHDYIVGVPILGGELRFSGNLTSLTRGANDPFMVMGMTYYYGLAGSTTRVSEEVSWRREIVAPLGQVLTPFAFARGDVYFLDFTAPPPGVTTDAIATRGLVGVGFEWRWPILITIGRSRHVVEPIAQVMWRSNEPIIGALPNDDAQSLYFDTTNLLSWNRSSGYDRIEGGANLTLAVRYTGQIGRASVQAMVGQSFHLAGVNSFGVPDLRNTGFGTGLEGTRSDLVASLSGSIGRGNSIAVSGRFDGATYELQRGTFTASALVGPVTASASLAFDRSRLNLEGGPEAAFRLTSRASIDLGGHWSLSGGLGYDFVTGTVVNNFVGVTFTCDCAAFSVMLSESRSAGSPVVNRSVLFNLQLRTLGDFDLRSLR